MRKSAICILLIGMGIITFSGCSSAKPVASGKPTSASKVVPVTAPATKQEKDLEHVKNVVASRSNQLQNLYKKQSSLQAMQGELNIKLYITEEGSVQNADIVVDTGNLSQEFIESIRRDILSWRFIIRDKMIYSFRIQFKKL